MVMESLRCICIEIAHVLGVVSGNGRFTLI